MLTSVYIQKVDNEGPSNVFSGRRNTGKKSKCKPR